MKGYLLDTSTCVAIFRGNRQVAAKLNEAGKEKCFVSPIVVAELLFGAYRSNTISDGYKWRTLSYSEWLYVFNTRISGSTVNSISNARYTIAVIKIDDKAVNGIILFPDGITLENSDVTSWGQINGISQITNCTSAQWVNLAAKGCAFLPAAGFRDGNSLRDVNTCCYYWSSSSNTEDVYYAFSVCLNSYELNPAKKYTRPCGLSVRLVREVE